MALLTASAVFVFTLIPMIYSLYAAFANWDGITSPVFSGIQNLREMFTKDDLFWKSVSNTLYYAFYP